MKIAGLDHSESNKMPKYIVEVREVHIAYYEVNAPTAEDAKEKAYSEYGPFMVEYSHQMGPEHTTVELKSTDD